MGTTRATACCTGALLAGGTSRRMGRDKRTLDIDGSPLLARAAAALAQACHDVLVVTASEADRRANRHLVADHPWLVDRRPGEGPLAGLETALAAARTELVVVLAGDHPSAAPAVLRLLATDLAAAPSAQAAVLVTARGAQPLVAAYRTSVLPTVSGLLVAGERRARRLLDHLDVLRIGPERWAPLDPDGDTSRDLDRPEDLTAYRARRVAQDDATEGGG